MKWTFTDKEATLEDVLAGIGKGWHPLVTKLIQDLIDDGWSGSIAQVKEKFGGLRFYAEGLGDRGNQLVDKAEKESCLICEVCGEPGLLRHSSWLHTACDEHDNITAT